MMRKWFALLAFMFVSAWSLNLTAEDAGGDLFGGLSVEEDKKTDDAKADAGKAAAGDEIDFGDVADDKGDKGDAGKAAAAGDEIDFGDADEKAGEAKADAGDEIDFGDVADDKGDAGKAAAAGAEIDFGDADEKAGEAKTAAGDEIDFDDDDDDAAGKKAPEGGGKVADTSAEEVDFAAETEEGSKKDDGEVVAAEETTVKEGGKVASDVQVIVVGEEEKGNAPTEPQPSAQELMRPAVKPAPMGAPASGDLKVISRTEIESEKRQLRSQSPLIPSDNIGRALLLYLPNRLLDIYDIVTMDMGFGPECKFQLTGTHYFAFGGFYGDKFYVSKAYNRKIGAGHSMGWSYDEAWKTNKRLFIDQTVGTLQDYYFITSEFRDATPEDPVYKDGIKDFWEMGVGVGWLCIVDFKLHPVDLADAVLGFFFIDIKGDDLQ